MPDPIDSKLDDALRGAIGSDLPTLERIATIKKIAAEAQKAGADTEKALSDAKLASTQLRTGRLQAWSSLLIPVVSVLTVLATTLIQSQQLSEARRQSQVQLEETRRQSEIQRVAAQEAAEDTRWNTFLGAVKSNADEFHADTTLVARLRTFVQSPRYKDQAVDIVKRIMVNISNSSGFRDLFEISFPTIDERSIDGVADIARKLNARRNFQLGRCREISNGLILPANADWSGICSPTITDDAALRAAEPINNPDLVKSQRNLFGELTDMGVFTSAKIGEYLRNRKSTSISTPINLSGIFFGNVSFDGIDFSNIDISESRLSIVSMKDTILTPVGRGTTDIIGNWWEAKTIDQNLLLKLTRDAYPYSHNYIYYRDGYKIDRDSYVKKVAALCTSRHRACDSKCLRFGEGTMPADETCAIEPLTAVEIK